MYTTTEMRYISEGVYQFWSGFWYVSTLRLLVMQALHSRQKPRQICDINKSDLNYKQTKCSRSSTTVVFCTCIINLLAERSAAEMSVLAC